MYENSFITIKKVGKSKGASHTGHIMKYIHTEHQQTPKTNTNTADLIQIHFSLFMKVEVAN